MRLSYPLGLQPHQGISAASRQTPLPPSLRSAPSPEEKVDKTASNNLPPRTNHRCFTRLEQLPASNHPAYFPSRLPRRQRGGWCRAANAARNLFGGSTSAYPAPVALSATRRTCAHSNQLRPPGLLLGGAMQPTRAKRGVSRTRPAVLRLAPYSFPLKHLMTFFANCVCTKRITRSPGSSTDSPFGMTAAPSRT